VRKSRYWGGILGSSRLLGARKRHLLERDVRLEDGEFRLKPVLKMTKLEDRSNFLARKILCQACRSVLILVGTT
jgi:hypothetical protein